MIFIVERIYEKEIHERASSEYMWKTKGVFTDSWRIKIALESNFGKRAQEIWERNLRKTTLLKVCNPILMETVLEVFREQFKEDDQMNTAGETAGLFQKPRSSMKNRERTRRILGNVNDRYLLEDLVLTAGPCSCEGSRQNQSHR